METWFLGWPPENLFVNLTLETTFSRVDFLMKLPLEMLFQGRLNVRRYKGPIFTIDGIVVVLGTSLEDRF
jgi:hypothetical protein